MPASLFHHSKNKERWNNPSYIPSALLPPDKEKGQEADTATLSNESDKVNMDSAGHKSGDTDSGDVSDTLNTTREVVIPTNNAKRTTARQRKAAFEEYKELYLYTPKIVNRKPVFISESTRDRMNKIARKLGYNNMSASGFLNSQKDEGVSKV